MLRISSANKGESFVQRSNEFNTKNLDDSINYKVSYQNLNDSNEIANKFIIKPRVVKEKEYSGSFRIPQQNLKKHVNPSEMFMKQQQQTINHNNYLPVQNTGNYGNYNSNSDEEFNFNSLDPNQEVTTNLMDVLSREVDKLKHECEMRQKELDAKNKMNSMKNNHLSKEIQEEKVTTDYLSQNNNRVQAFKHVSTQNKPEYNSLEDLQREKENHLRRLKESEMRYESLKNKTNEGFKFSSKISMDEMEQTEPSVNIDKVIRHTEKDLNEYKNKTKISMPKRPKSSLLYGKKGVNRGYSQEGPLGKSEKRYLNKYMRYLAKKNKMTESKMFEEENTIEWNTTKVRSYNAKGFSDRNDGMPGKLDVGHLDGEDYSIYYMSIDSNNSLSLSQSLSRGNSRPKKLKKGYKPKYVEDNEMMNLTYDYAKISSKGKPSTTQNKSGSNISYNNQGYKTSSQNNLNNTKKSKKANNNISAHIAFIKLIFNLLDKGKVGEVKKIDLIRDLNLDQNILHDLGFESEETLLNSLKDNKTSKEGYVNEDEFIQFLLSNLDVNFGNQLHKTSSRDTNKPKIEESNLNDNNNGNNNGNNAIDPNSTANKKVSFNKSLLFKETPTNNNVPQQHVVNVEYDENDEQNNGETLDDRDLVRYSMENDNNAMDNNNQDQDNYCNYGSNTNEFNNDYNNKLTQKITNKIEKNSNTQYEFIGTSNSKLNHPRKIQVSHRDYKEFTTRFKEKNDLTFTIPKPYAFQVRDEEKDGRPNRKIQALLDERREKEEAILGYRFRANELKSHIFINQCESMNAAAKEIRQFNLEHYKKKVEAEMKPFSFYENDKNKYLERIHKVEEAPEYLPFKANPIPWSSQVNIYEDMISKGKVLRQTRVEERARQNLINAKLPPRMEMHERKKKEAENNMKLLKPDNETTVRSKSNFRAKKIPEFTVIHEQLNKNLEKKKSIAKLTETKPFNFHEPKKKASLRGYLDRENNPEIKNPQVKKNILEVIQQIQHKPKIEPKSTKGLNLLMGQRRKEMEDKQRKDEEKLEEDRLRLERQNKLKDRVVNSGFLVDNTKALEESRKQKQENFKKNLREEKKKYEEDLQIRLQKIYNKPLMFESSTKKMDKMNNMMEMKDKLGNLLNPEEKTEEEMREREKIMKETLGNSTYEPAKKTTTKKEANKSNTAPPKKTEDKIPEVKLNEEPKIEPKVEKKQEVKEAKPVEQPIEKKETKKEPEVKKEAKKEAPVEDVVDEEYGDGGFEN